MSRPRPLFIIGNKRSGSTLMTDLPNVHPRVFVSHESDIAWILYQAREGWPDAFAELIPQMVYRRGPNQKYAGFPLPDVPRAARIMKIYGY